MQSIKTLENNIIINNVNVVNYSRDNNDFIIELTDGSELHGKFLTESSFKLTGNEYNLLENDIERDGSALTIINYGGIASQDNNTLILE